MANIGYVEAFKKFGAKLDNPMWAVSAIADDGAFVLSCWSHLFVCTSEDTLKYVDSLGRWNGNIAGNNLLKKHLSFAYENKLPVRLIIATALNAKDLEGCDDASKIKKKFHIRDDLVGNVERFDGDNFAIEFKKKP